MRFVRDILFFLYKLGLLCGHYVSYDNIFTMRLWKKEKLWNSRNYSKKLLTYYWKIIKYQGFCVGYCTLS